MSTSLLSAQQFTTLLGQLDENMQKTGVPIPSRPLAAASEIAKILSINVMGYPRGQATNDVYNTETIFSHIDEWFTRRYGKRLNIKFQINSVAILIKNDPWRLNLPYIWGEILIQCDPSTFGDSLGVHSGPRNNPPILNILNCIESMTKNYASKLTIEELNKIKT